MYVQNGKRETTQALSAMMITGEPDGSGRSERVHTVVGRLRSSLAEMSSQISVISGNSKYQLKIAHSIEEKTPLDDVL